jgi:hypothetical protein
MKAMTGWALVMTTCATIMAAHATSDVISDRELVTRAQSVLAVKEAPIDRVLGIHDGQMIIVDVRCSGTCPASTVRIIHYAGNQEAVCARADLVTVDVFRGLTIGPEKFCVPHALVQRRLYTDRPYQR